jgi:hypothetical protein
MSLSVYELEDRDEQNEFIDDLLSNGKDGTVPIYLSTVVDRGESDDIDYNVVAMSVGKPIDPAELQAEVDKYLPEEEEEDDSEAVNEKAS